MQTKGGPKKPQRRGVSELPSSLHPYEQERLKQCMRNSARLKQLGIPGLTSVLAMAASVHADNDKSKQRNSEDVDEDYDPSQDDTTEGDLVDDTAKGSKKTRTQTSDLQPSGGVKFKPRKRVFPDMPSTRATRSQKRIAKPDARLAPSEVPVPKSNASEVTVPNVSNASLTSEVPVPNINQVVELVGNFDNHTQAAIEDDGLNLLGENTPMPGEGDGHSEDIFGQHEDNTLMTNGDDGNTHSDGHNEMTNEGEEEEEEEEEEDEEEWNRGVNMGHGLQRLTRARRRKLPIVIDEGKIRPVVPVLAAKWATECNITVRNHIPVFKHWKEYKKQPVWIKRFLGHIRAKFDVDTSNSIIKKACTEMMKKAVRQQRHRLKKTFFDPFPLHLVMKTSPVKSMSNQQWIDLVESWKSPKKMETCQTNKDNRGNVRLHQTTGSQSYTVFVEVIGDKHNNREPDAFDLFKDCHYSNKTKGYTPAVQATIAQIENKLSTTTEGEASKSVNQVVAEVLGEKTRKNQFLRNVGIKTVPCTSGKQNDAVQELQAENAELRSIINTQHGQIDDLTKKFQETEEGRMRDREEMKKKQGELEAKLELVLSKVQQS